MAEPGIASRNPDTTDDGFLGGKLILRQPRRGHRAGHDAVILAASTHAQAGQLVIDLGAGVGAAGLALATRVRGVDLVMVEIDPALAALADFNARANGIAARVVVADVGAGIVDGMADQVLMNPPFHDSARHRASPDAARRIAHTATDETLRTWIDAAYRLLKTRGVLTLIWRADGLADVLQALGDRFGGVELQPVHGARGKPAVRILLSAMKGGRAPLVIHQAALLDGSDVAVETAMRGEGALPLAERALR